MDEKNHYGNAMIKPLPTGSIKKMKNIPSLKEFDFIIHGISYKDKIGHLFVADIELDHKNADEKQLFFNEICTPNFEKKKSFICQRKICFPTLRCNEAKR